MEPRYLASRLDPHPPARLAGRASEPLRGDLDAVVLKALAKDPSERYRSMESLAADLQRDLNGHPVQARRATTFHRAIKLVRRHRARVAASAVAALALLVGAGAWWGSARSLEQSRLEQGRMAEQAEQAEKQAEAVTTFARNLMLATGPDAGDGGRFTSRQMLDRGQEQARAVLADEPETLAHQLEALGLAYQALGELEAARGPLEESLDLRRRVYGRGDHRLVARGLNNLAALLDVAGDHPRAERLYRLAINMKRRLGQPPEELTRARSNLASLLVARGEYEEAEALHLQILDTRRRAFGEEDVENSNSLRSLGNLLYLRGDFEAAEARLRQALTLRRREYGEDSTRVASVLSLLGRVLHAQGRLDEADDVLSRTLDVRVRRMGDDHLHVALTRKDLASLAFDRGETERAEELWTRALWVLREKKPPDSWELADADSQLGGRLLAAGRIEEARPLLERSYEILRRERGERAVYTRWARDRLKQLQLQVNTNPSTGPF